VHFREFVGCGIANAQYNNKTVEERALSFASVAQNVFFRHSDADLSLIFEFMVRYSSRSVDENFICFFITPSRSSVYFIIGISQNTFLISIGPVKYAIFVVVEM
jgi:hypothetical protein